VPIAEQHIAGFHAVLGRVARQRKYLAIVEAPPLPAVREFVLRNIRHGVPQMVALDGDSVVGWCDIVPDARESSRHCGRLAMGVDPDYRGRGIGSRLMLATLAAAESRGLERIELHVVETNQVAIRLYEKFGFEQEGILRNARKLDGRYEHKIAMSLFLHRPETAGRQLEETGDAAGARECSAGNKMSGTEADGEARRDEALRDEVLGSEPVRRVSARPR